MQEQGLALIVGNGEILEESTKQGVYDSGDVVIGTMPFRVFTPNPLDLNAIIAEVKKDETLIHLVIDISDPAVAKWWDGITMAQFRELSEMQIAIEVDDYFLIPRVYLDDETSEEEEKTGPIFQ